MSNVSVYRSHDVSAGARASAILQRVTQNVEVEVVDATRLTDLNGAWAELLTRADAPNVFMDPALVAVADAADPSTQHRALLAWKHIDGRRQLAGVWTFAITRARKSPLPVRFLSAPAFTHGYLATPVIDRHSLDETLDAMLDTIANDASLPKLIALDTMGTDGATYEALVRVLEQRDSASCIFEQSRRPKLISDLDGKAYLEKAVSSSTRKKLRQHRRRLSETGALTSVMAIEPAAVRQTLEEFLAMEAAGWKGKNGTALLSNPSDAAFMRGALGVLADHHNAAIHSLYLDGKPVSMQIVVRAGGAAFTWKTAYAEQFQDFSPGMLLLEDYTAALLADKTIAYVDSCSLDDTGFMAAWTERQAVADLWIDARRGGSLEFRVLSTLQKTYRDLRATAKDTYLNWRKPRKK
jgi:CelD/BcsL family acetyltransferase involved in cellulose biosynthesis